MLQGAKYSRQVHDAHSVRIPCPPWRASTRSTDAMRDGGVEICFSIAFSFVTMTERWWAFRFDFPAISNPWLRGAEVRVDDEPVPRDATLPAHWLGSAAVRLAAGYHGVELRGVVMS